MSQEKETHRAGLYYVIPSEIMDSDQLTPTEKLLYGLLSGFADDKGECFPSDTYLAERLNIKAREPINRMIAKFEEMGILTKRTIPHPSNPFKKKRIITLYRQFKKSLRSDLQVTVGGDLKVTPALTLKSHIESEDIRVSKEKKYTKEKVSMEMEEYQKLCLELGQETADHWISKLNDYIQAKGVKYKSHYHTIKMWLSKEPKGAGPKALSDQDINSQLIAKVKSSIPRHPDIEYGETYIDFKCFGPMGYIKFTDNGFRERVVNNLRKMNLNVKGL